MARDEIEVGDLVMNTNVGFDRTGGPGVVVGINYGLRKSVSIKWPQIDHICIDYIGLIRIYEKQINHKYIDQIAELIVKLGGEANGV